MAHYNLASKEILHVRGRIYIKTLNPKETTEKLVKVFGISSISPANQTTSKMDEITRTSLNLARNAIKNKSTFAVRCHRVGTQKYSSLDVCKEIGEQILTHLKNRKPKVDLTNPDFTLNIEVRNEDAYVYAETIRGPGGFPVGSQPKVICLLSGGIDSPVACWLAMKRGCTILPIYLDNTPLTDDQTTAKGMETARKLFEWSIGFPRRVYIVPHGKNVQTFMEKTPRRLTCLLCKRMMYRIAERIADNEKAEGIVTGEAIGEQASQTLTNLRVLDQASRTYPVHRPLLGFDKTETEALAKRIGTYEISIWKAKSCSAAPSKPATAARLEAVKEAEKGLDVDAMTEDSFKTSKIITL